MTINDLNNQFIRIDDFNTNYISLNFENINYRFDFLGKKEAFLKEKNECKLLLFSDHPLLIDYNESFLEIFLNSKPKNIDFFLENIERIIHNRVLGFRKLKDYLNKSNLDFETFLKNINEGNGKFLNAPFSIIDEIEKFFIENNIKFKTFGEPKKFENQLLILDNQYVIATEFKLK
ncbi:hypothetical protein [Empedobacter falsenii]